MEIESEWTANTREKVSLLAVPTDEDLQSPTLAAQGWGTRQMPQFSLHSSSFRGEGAAVRMFFERGHGRFQGGRTGYPTFDNNRADSYAAGCTQVPGVERAISSSSSVMSMEMSAKRGVLR